MFHVHVVDPILTPGVILLLTPTCSVSAAKILTAADNLLPGYQNDPKHALQYPVLNAIAK